MLFVRHGVLLGILFFLSFHVVEVVGQSDDECNTLCMSDQSDTDQRVFVECCAVQQQRDDLLFQPITILDIARANIRQEQFCQWRYGLSKDQIRQLLKLSYAHIVYRLLELKYVSDAGVYELWSLYKDRCWKQREVARCEEALRAGLQDRAYQQRKQEQQQKLLQQEALAREKESKAIKLKHQKQLIQEHQSYQSLLESQFESLYYADRYDALLESERFDYKQYEQEYELDAQIRGYLYAQGVDYKEYQQCFGTALQQQFHQEICDIFQEVAHESLKRPDSIGKSLLFEHGCNFAHAANESNQNGCVSVTAILLDIGHACVAIGFDIMDRPGAYLQALAGGVYDSVSDFAQVVVHPVTTVSSLGQMIYFVFETAALQQAAVDFDSNILSQRYAERERYICETLSHLKNHFLSLDAPEKLRALTKFCADFTVTPKIAHACTYMLAGTLKRGACIESALGMMAEEFGAAEAAEEAVALVQEAELLAEQQLAAEIGQQFAEAESVINKAASIAPRPLKVILDEVRAFKNGVIPLHCTELADEFKAALKVIEDALKSKKLAELRKLYEYRTIDGKRVQMALNHILNFELKLTKSKKGHVLYISGGHLAGACEALEATGLVKIVNKKHLPSGAIDYYMRNLVTSEMFKKPKTSFPAHWNEEHICEKIWSIYENPSLPIVDCDGSNKVYKVGSFGDIDIKVHWSAKGKNKQTLDYICTAFPMQ